METLFFRYKKRAARVASFAWQWMPASKTKHPATHRDGAFPHIYVRSGYILGAAANIKLKIKKRI